MRREILSFISGFVTDIEVNVPKISIPLWADPKLWLAGAAILIIITIVAIYYKVFTGEKRP